ncbi:sensor histidine kinase [Sinomonas terrae]|nr:GAF domain-containing protein [Sinomonas terrae]
MSGEMPRRVQDLLREFVERAEELVRIQDHMNSLIGAVISIAEDLSLQSVLERVVQSACELVGAQYGALGVLGEDQRLSHFITVGIDDDQVRLIGDFPTGHGVLGQLIRDPKPLRLHDLHQHPVSVGFPENHPPMKTFLGVPIRVREAIFGNLYLTEKANGQDFTVEDEELAIALAAAAGVAIQNARLYDVSRRRQRWLEAGMTTSEELISNGGRAPEEDLDLVAEWALQASESVLAIMADQDRGDEGFLSAKSFVGDLALPQGARLPSPPALANAVAEGRPVLIHDPSALFDGGTAEKLGDVLVIPLGHASQQGPILLLARRAGTGQYSQTDLESAVVFGSQVGLALGLNRARRRREEVLIGLDRDRIALDLHDLVIRRLFLVGLSIQGLRGFTAGSGSEAKIAAITNELDASIRELRSTIYSLGEGTKPGEQAFSRALVDLVTGAVRDASVVPRFNIAGRVDDIPSPIARQVLAVVSEAVSNAVKHSGAANLTVSLAAEAAALEVLVEDDGQGFDNPGRVSGLDHMRHRAESLGGDCVIESTSERGTTVRWRIPLPPTH